MLRIRLLALVSLGFLAFALGASPGARAGVQMYNGSWVADSFGNDRIKATATTTSMGMGTHHGTDESEFFSVFAMPQGILCNPLQPICSFSSSPTTGGVFNPLGPNCQPLTNMAVWSKASRPAKGGTVTTKGQLAPDAPRYRNPFFFTAGGAPKMTDCTATTTVGMLPASMVLTTNDPLRGVVMKGAPLTGMGSVSTLTTGPGGAFSFAKAPATPGPGLTGFRRTTLGEFNAIYPYLYSYTYATLRNSSGFFGQGGGFFTTAATPTMLTIPYTLGMGTTVATVKVKQGANNFGGVMRLLGQLTTKVCYFRQGGCSLGVGNNWLYQYIGESAPFGAMGTVTKPYIKTFMGIYYHTNLMQSSVLTVRAERFPWTTGTATVKAFRGPHKTIERRAGYDNRTATSGKGQIQLVSPIITHWLQNCCKFETGGIAILRLEFLPEPRYWMMLVGGLSMLGVLYHFRGR